MDILGVVVVGAIGLAIVLVGVRRWARGSP